MRYFLTTALLLAARLAAAESVTLAWDPPASLPTVAPTEQLAYRLVQRPTVAAPWAWEALVPLRRATVTLPVDTETSCYRVSLVRLNATGATLAESAPGTLRDGPETDLCLTPPAPPPPPTCTPIPVQVPARLTLPATLAVTLPCLPDATAKDFIALTAPGKPDGPDSAPTTFSYLNTCTRTAGPLPASLPVTCRLPLPPTLPGGTYRVRLYLRGSWLLRGGESRLVTIKR